MNDSNVPEWLLNSSFRIIEHMNENHSNSIVSTLNAQHGIKDKNAKMEKLQVNGYFALSNQKLYFLDFPRKFLLDYKQKKLTSACPMHL